MGTRVLKITGDLLVGILQGFQDGPPRFFFVSKDPIPPDAAVRSVRYDWNYDWWVVELASAAWTQAGEGEEIRPEFTAVNDDAAPLTTTLRREYQKPDAPSAN